MKKLFFLLFLAISVNFLCVYEAQAQTESFSTRAEAANARTLISQRYTITLWGLEDVSGLSPNTRLRGRMTLDRMIADKAVQCEIVDWVADNKPIARCLLDDNTDLAVKMLERGFASADRTALNSNVHEDVYLQAESMAQRSNAGIWKAVNNTNVSESTDPISPEAFYILFACVGLGLILMIVLHMSLKRRVEKLDKYLKNSIARLKASENEMRQREKYVLAAMLQKEIQDNKDKTEAFIIVNRDLLESIKSAKAKTMLHRYQQSGEIVQKQPVLNRSVFDNNVNRLDLLEPDVMQKIIDLYASLSEDPEYLTLNKEIPLHEAINHVQVTLLDAEKTLEPFDKIYSALNIIMEETKRRKIYKSAKAAAVSNAQ